MLNTEGLGRRSEEWFPDHLPLFDFHSGWHLIREWCAMHEFDGWPPLSCKSDPFNNVHVFPAIRRLIQWVRAKPKPLPTAQNELRQLRYQLNREFSTGKICQFVDTYIRRWLKDILPTLPPCLHIADAIQTYPFLLRKICRVTTDPAGQSPTDFFINLLDWIDQDTPFVSFQYWDSDARIYVKELLHNWFDGLSLTYWSIGQHVREHQASVNDPFDTCDDIQFECDQLSGGNEELASILDFGKNVLLMRLNKASNELGIRYGRSAELGERTRHGLMKGNATRANDKQAAQDAATAEFWRRHANNPTLSKTGIIKNMERDTITDADGNTKYRWGSYDTLIRTYLKGIELPEN